MVEEDGGKGGAKSGYYSGAVGGLAILYCSNFENTGSITAKGVSGDTWKYPSSDAGVYVSGSSGAGSVAIFAKSLTGDIQQLKIGINGNYRNSRNWNYRNWYGGYGGPGRAAFISLETEEITALGIN